MPYPGYTLLHKGMIRWGWGRGFSYTLGEMLLMKRVRGRQREPEGARDRYIDIVRSLILQQHKKKECSTTWSFSIKGEKILSR